MTLTIKSRNLLSLSFQNSAGAPARPTKNGHSKALPVGSIDLQQPGRLRAGHLMTLFSVGHSTLYNHIRAGLIPQPDGADGARPYWKTETVRLALQK
ncbi:hypothetical protein [Massilia litorea]|uniref:Uncharacterized protein n=1 Tax=Massilia litorea TaxID=2769491 RepID=A0A7L9U583_9BURK|nr:hypothetical protein [Massilia litorea]QOL50231.1 hypothetical protein LPB04_02645 [Massilia litorea]